MCGRNGGKIISIHSMEEKTIAFYDWMRDIFY